jgi:hypothetical protein
MPEDTTAGGSQQATRPNELADSREVPDAIARLLPDFVPETDLEARVVQSPELIQGLAWGEPREGHPEGSIAAHVEDLLETLEEWDEPPERRVPLRFITLVHDSFKGAVNERLPKVGRNHHADRARRFAEDYTDDQAILWAIQHHDRPYALWRKMRRKGKLDERGFQKMLDDIPDLPLFVRFVELDGSTEGKNREPIRWLRAELERRGHSLPQPPRCPPA